jgi:hypothetical protein
MRRRRRLWTILLAAPFLLLLADTVYWHIAIRNLENGFAAWVAAQQAAGWTERHGAPTRGGWPLAATLTFPRISLAAGGAAGTQALIWSADTVVLRVALQRPQELQVAADGQQHLRLGNGPDVPLHADRFRLVLPLDAAPWPPFVDLTIEGLHAKLPAGDAAIRSLGLHLEISAEAHSGEPAVEFSLQADAVDPPAPFTRALGPRIAHAEVEGELSGPMSPSRTLADWAAAWRDGGGSLEVSHLALVWGPLDVTGSATLALDEQLQPMGTGTARLVGYAETLDALAGHGAISRSAAVAAKAVLSLLAHSPDDGGPPDVEVPLTLQYRTLSMRQVPLVRLPEVDWP